jgi:hypothetical protein
MQITIFRFPLRASTYSGNLLRTVNGDVADWFQDVFMIDEADGDYYGSGKLPRQGRVLVQHDWFLG